MCSVNIYFDENAVSVGHIWCSSLVINMVFGRVPWYVGVKWRVLGFARGRNADDGFTDQ